MSLALKNYVRPPMLSLALSLCAFCPAKFCPGAFCPYWAFDGSLFKVTVNNTNDWISFR